MHVEDARGFCDMGQFEHAGFAERDLGVVVTGLPTLFHGGTGELKVLGRRLISARLVFQLHEGSNSDARFLLQELHLGALFEDVGQLIQEFCQREPEFLRFLVLDSGPSLMGLIALHWEVEADR